MNRDHSVIFEIASKYCIHIVIKDNSTYHLLAPPVKEGKKKNHRTVNSLSLPVKLYMSGKINLINNIKYLLLPNSPIASTNQEKTGYFL